MLDNDFMFTVPFGVFLFSDFVSEFLAGFENSFCIDTIPDILASDLFESSTEIFKCVIEIFKAIFHTVWLVLVDVVCGHHLKVLA